MKNKVILISIDGMRPDGVMQCGNPYVKELMKTASYTLDAKTVFPSVTLPCHMSMFHSVPPERHGITTNLYMPPVRPISGLFEQVKSSGKTCAMFYGWEPLRDVARPGSLIYAGYQNAYSADNTDGLLTEKALTCIKELTPDFVFLYMVETDEKGGHDNGWMSEPYLGYIHVAIENVKRVYEAIQEVREKTGDNYTLIITSDHGGHDRLHGTQMKEDMTIPTFFIGDRFEPGKQISDVSILDLAPTIADIMGVPIPREWEGTIIH